MRTSTVFWEGPFRSVGGATQIGRTVMKINHDGSRSYPYAEVRWSDHMGQPSWREESDNSYSVLEACIIALSKEKESK